jgi:hypothetical protein
MATRTWTGVIGDWNTDADWLPATAGADMPTPGDTAVIASGTVILTTNGPAADGLFENNPVTLGALGGAGATLLLRDTTPIGRYFTITLAGAATIETDGDRAIAGSITGNLLYGETVTFKSDPGGDLVLLHGGSFNVSTARLDFEGDTTIERDATVSGSLSITLNGTLSILEGSTTFSTNSLTGTGTIDIGGAGKLFLDGLGASNTTQTVSFSGLGGTLGLAYNTSYSGSIENFASGDFIDWVGGSVTSASVDTAAHTLTVTNSANQSYLFNNFHAAAGNLSAVLQSNGHYLIGYTSAAPQLNYQIDAGARAMHADIVHQMVAPGTSTPITGAGVKIGIISDSFNINGGAASDVAHGYLPASGVTVLTEGAAGDYDEGRAMAELIYQTAPGASLYFASTGSGVNDFANSVQALQAAGCTVIVDDIGLDEPYFQLGSPAETAISNAIAGGVAFVSAAGNNGDAYYQHAFSTSAQTLFDGSTVQAMTFSNGTPYQSIRAFGGQYDAIDLQWDASYYGAGGVASDQPCCITVEAFDATTNALVATSTQVSSNGHLVAETVLNLPPSNSAINYNIAIIHNNGAPAVSEIKYIFTGEGFTGGSSQGGRINDPDAGVGSGAITGHQLIPGDIVVAAADVVNTPASAIAPDFTEYFSSTGPGQLLFDANGNPLAQPITVGSPDVTGPDAIQTSVSGFTPFYGTSAAAPNVAAVAALVQQVDPGITPAELASILAQSATPLSDEPASVAGAGLVQADRAVQLAEALACYCAGTLVLTSTGERAIETLDVGDLIVTASGARRSVKWLGHRRLDLSKHPAPKDVWPVRIASGAFGDDLPRRDLWVSPGHNIAWSGALMPAIALANGHSVAQIAVGSVDYWHVELDAHDILLAEGLPAESYLDCGNRTAFANGGALVEAHPDFKPKHWMDTCLPLVKEGPRVAAAKARLIEMLQAQGYDVTRDAAAHLVADGQRFEPTWLSETRLAFILPDARKSIAFHSNSFVPAFTTPESTDVRELGLCVARLQIDGDELALDRDDLFNSGWHEAEREQGRAARRWTNGAARLPGGGRIVIVDLGGFGLYWREPIANVVALFGRGIRA